ncbi:MAG: group II intron maturase-specific domain-containing protein, partial [Terracidiphilus sp.]
HKTVVTKLNQMMNGCANYFCLGPVSKAYRAADRHTCKRLRQWLCAKHKKATLASRKYSGAYLHDRFGLVRLTERTRNFSWAKP